MDNFTFPKSHGKTLAAITYYRAFENCDCICPCGCLMQNKQVIWQCRQHEGLCQNPFGYCRYLADTSCAENFCYTHHNQYHTDGCEDIPGVGDSNETFSPTNHGWLCQPCGTVNPPHQRNCTECGALYKIIMRHNCKARMPPGRHYCILDPHDPNTAHQTYRNNTLVYFFTNPKSTLTQT